MAVSGTVAIVWRWRIATGSIGCHATRRDQEAEHGRCSAAAFDRMDIGLRDGDEGVHRRAVELRFELSVVEVDPLCDIGAEGPLVEVREAAGHVAAGMIQLGKRLRERGEILAVREVQAQDRPIGGPEHGERGWRCRGEHGRRGSSGARM